MPEISHKFGRNWPDATVFFRVAARVQIQLKSSHLDETTYFYYVWSGEGFPTRQRDSLHPHTHRIIDYCLNSVRIEFSGKAFATIRRTDDATQRAFPGEFESQLLQLSFLRHSSRHTFVLLVRSLAFWQETQFLLLSPDLLSDFLLGRILSHQSSQCILYEFTDARVMNSILPHYLGYFNVHILRYVH